MKKFKQAKSSISEDVQIIKNTFQKEKLGTVITTAGASGGVTYKPMMSKEELRKLLKKLLNYSKKKNDYYPVDIFSYQI